MIEREKKATLLWVNHCYEPTKDKISLWLVPGDHYALSDTKAREIGTFIVGPTEDIKGCQDLARNLDKALRTLNIAIVHEETADD